MKKRVTVKDVAKYANVSPSTVSRVLNGYPFIKEDTRQKVEQAIRELKFEPNELARSLITRKTKTFGLVVDISNPFFSETAKVIINRARELNYDILIYDTNGDEDMEQIANFLINKNVSGMIVGSVERSDRSCEKLAEEGFHVVFFNRKPDNSGLFTVTMNNKKASRMAVEHLVQKGHRRIAFVGGLFKYSTFFDRYLGFLDAVQEFGLHFDEELLFSGKLTSENILRFVTAVLSKKDRPTAIIAASDQLAITVLSAVSSTGLKVPEDVAVIGFDNIDISSNPYIGLTTIAQQKTKMAEIALDQLIYIVENDFEKDELPEPVVLEPKLIVRSTT
jgi:LacI family transcriptional regulator